VSFANVRADKLDIWSGRLLAIAGIALLAEAVSSTYGWSLSGVPFWWLVSSIPYGIGFALAPVVLLRSYQYLAEHTPRSAVVGVAFVAVLPVGTVLLVAWGVVGLTVGPVPEIAVLPVRLMTVFLTLLGSFTVGIATFGVMFLKTERTRLLGASLLAFALAWAIPMTIVKLSGVYPAWLANLLIVSVATTMIAIGSCFPPATLED